MAIHYRINPSHTGTTAPADNQIIAAIKQATLVWKQAVPYIDFAYDGPSTEMPSGGNNVVGFSANTATGYANLPMTSPDGGKTYNGFSVALNSAQPWSWDPCDALAGPCPPSAESGVDIQNTMTHSWGHVLGLDDTGSNDYRRDVLLTDFGGVASGPDCHINPTCRFADTLGLGDVLGARALYPTSAPMPTLYYDQ